MLRIGYIDEDPGWRSTFRSTLKEDFEIVLFDITDQTTQESLTNDIFESALDMLVVDFRLDETGLVDFNADSLVDEIRKRNLYYPMIILTSHEIDALNHLDDANLINGKDMLDGGDLKVKVLARKIKKIATDYSRKTQEYETELLVLEKKRSSSGLMPNEEDRYLELNTYLEKTVSAKGHLPRSFYTEDTRKKLDAILEETEKLFKLISGNK